MAEKNLDRIREGQAKELETHLGKAIGLAKDSGMRYEDFQEMSRLLWEEG